MKSDTEIPQLRLTPLSLHRQVLRLGPQRNFWLLLGLLTAFVAVTWAMIQYSSPLPESSDSPWLSFFPVFLFILASHILHEKYFLELPQTKCLLAFFEKNHPELCSWLDESAILEAKSLYEGKAA